MGIQFVRRNENDAQRLFPSTASSKMSVSKTGFGIDFTGKVSASSRRPSCSGAAEAGMPRLTIRTDCSHFRWTAWSGQGTHRGCCASWWKRRYVHPFHRQALSLGRKAGS